MLEPRVNQFTPMFRPSISQTGLMIVVFLLATELIFVGLLVSELDELRTRLHEEQQKRLVLEHLTNSTNRLQRFYLDMIRDNNMVDTNERETANSDYASHRKSIDADFKILEETLQNDPKGIKDLKDLKEQKDRVIHGFLEAFRSNNLANTEQLKTLLGYSGAEAAKAVEMTTRYGSYVPSTTDDEVSRVELLLTVGLVMNFVTILLTGLFFWKRVSSRIMVVVENISRSTDRDELLPPLDGADEVAKIDSALHYLDQELAAAAARERALIEDSTDVICSIDSRGIFREVGFAALEQWGYHPEELVGSPVAETLGTKNIPSVFQQNRADIADDSRFALDERVRRRDGTFIDTRWAAHWSPTDGSLFCIVRDRSESKRIADLLTAQESEVRSAIENMPLGIFTTSKDGQIHQANRTARSLFGESHETSDSSASSLVDLNIDNLMVAGDRGGEKLSAALLNPSTNSPIRCTARGFDGKIFHVDVSLGRSSDSEDEKLVVLFDDASERVNLEKMKGNFVALLGENLRTPLDTVRRIVSSEMEASDSESKTKRLARIVPNVDRLLKLIDGLLEMEKLEPGKLVGELVPCAVSEILAVSVNSVRDHAEQQRIQLSSSVATRAKVNADEQRLIQVLVNLLTNAIKYSPAGTAVSVEVEEGPTEIELRVVDQGRGLAKEMHEAIFESYVQTQKSDAKRGSGTGLGLAICKQIIQSHKGSIGVTSEIGKGSTFWIKLPLSDAEDK
jgi:PAS domain S-box-containing protein